MSEKKEDKDYILVFAGLAVLFIFIVMGTTYFHYTGDKNYDNRGTFGDMFGAANALFTGLSFVGLIVTILLQRKDLNTQRDELQKQTQSINKQNFENTFFQLLSLFNSVTSSIEITNDEGTYKGRSAINEMSIHLTREIFKAAKKKGKLFTESTLNQAVKDLEKTEIMEIYIDFYNYHQELIGHYFRTFYHVIKLIHNNDEIDKRFYISIARSQLSSTELVLLFYNGVSPRGIRKFRPLINKYSVLENINFDLIPNLKLRSEYENSAFYTPISDKTTT
ncbi:putative phage abortive infection protein [Chryseobacterium kwangjuense]|uniref:Phage abortive infection protein n=1 Tax=Chryseobacterium kwangjuense TaxID=267125 RepID=A0ABW9K8Q0_9FLAO